MNTGLDKYRAWSFLRFYIFNNHRLKIIFEVRWMTVPWTATLISPVIFLHYARCLDRYFEHLQTSVKTVDVCNQDEPSHPAESRSLCPLIPHFKEAIGWYIEGNLPAAILDHGLQKYQYLNRSLHPLIFCYFSLKRSKAFTICWIETTVLLRRLMVYTEWCQAWALVSACLFTPPRPGSTPSLSPSPRTGQGGIEGWGFGGSTDIRALL